MPVLHTALPRQKITPETHTTDVTIGRSSAGHICFDMLLPKCKFYQQIVKFTLIKLYNFNLKFNFFIIKAISTLKTLTGIIIKSHRK